MPCLRFNLQSFSRIVRQVATLSGLVLLIIGYAGLSEAETVARVKSQTVYVPAYSHVLSGDRGLPFNVATTLGIRNTDFKHPITIASADYYDSQGKLVKKYLEKPVVLGPLASTDIFIKERDEHGGFGASFIVSWQSQIAVSEPVIECVIIGAKSGQGISFISPGRVLMSN